MINLEKISGLPIEISEDYQLKFKGGLPEVKPSVRKFVDLVPVLMDPNSKSDKDEMYYMYRDIHLPEHEDIIRRNHIRYDITVIPPTMIGREFNKTVGHYHPPIGNTEIAYPEAYEVIHGEALFLIQKLNKEDGVSMVIAIHGKTGDKVIYPPNYGHVMINIGNDVLVTSNWVSDQFESVYQPIVDKKGMAYFAVKGEGKLFDFVSNPSYVNTPEIRVLEAASNPGAKMIPLGPMYLTGVNQPAKFDFLNNPSKFALELSAISS